MLSGPRPAPLAVTASRRALAGFLLSGLIFAFPGPILIAWNYHRLFEYPSIGLFFLFMGIGVWTAVRMARGLLRQFGTKAVLMAGCFAAAAGFALLAFDELPNLLWWRRGAFSGLGVALGLLHASLFQLIAPVYERSAAAVVNLSGILFGAGSLGASLLVAGSFGAYQLWLPMTLFAAIAFGYGVWYARSRFPEITRVPELLGPAEDRPDYRSLSAIAIVVVVFLQFGNEWSVAAWLPLFLVQRLGVSPTTAVGLLALYWTALAVGRIVAQPLLQRVRHRRILLVGAGAALFGCLVMGLTNNMLGAVTAVLAIGLGFSCAYPLLTELVRGRFSRYHPVYFEGVFSVALTGGLLAPWAVGAIAGATGIGGAILLPAFGTLAVFVLLLVLRFAAKLNLSN